MTQPGYHPICVLFQGNDCAFDGTYRLVCRHQVRQTDFKPGDNVEVDMGDDDDTDAATGGQDDVEVINEDEDGDGRRWRDAIALGDEMVMSLLRNMCKNQPAGKSPWGTNGREARKKRNHDRRDEVCAKRIKTEECTTSQGNTTSVDSHQSDNLQKILSAIHSVQSSNDVVKAKLHNIQQHQVQLSEQVAAIHTTLSRLEESSKDAAAAADDSGSDVATPVSLFLSSQPQDSSPLGRGVAYSGVRQPSQSPVASASSTNSHSQIIISNPMSQSQPDLSTFPSQETTDPGMQTLPPLYPIETSYSHPQVLYNFRYTDPSEFRVYLGYPNSPLTLSKNEMEDILFKTNTPAAFAYRLAGKVFSKEELLTSNTSGKGNKKTGKTFKQLNLKYVNIILMEVETRFPTCRNTRESTKRLFAAINERCRNERKKLIYRCDKAELRLLDRNEQNQSAPSHTK